MNDLIEMLKNMQPSKAEPKPEKETEPKKSGKVESQGGGIKKSDWLSHGYDEIVRHTDKATLFRYAKSCFWLPKRHYVSNGEGLVFSPPWMQVSMKPYVEKKK